MPHGLPCVRNIRFEKFIVAVGRPGKRTNHDDLRRSAQEYVLLDFRSGTPIEADDSQAWPSNPYAAITGRPGRLRRQH